MSQHQSEFPHVRAVEQADALAFDYALNGRDLLRAEIVQRNRPVVVLSRWKSTGSSCRRTGKALEFAAHHLDGVLDLLHSLQRASQEPHLRYPAYTLRPFDEYLANGEGDCEGEASASRTPFIGGAIDLVSEQQRGRTPCLEWFRGHQVHALALAKSPWGDFDFLLCDDVVFLDHGTFEFARYMEGEAEHERAYTIIARDILGDPTDIVAWQPEAGRLATWLNRASILGEDQMNVPRLAEGLPVFETPLQWLQQRRLGVVVIDSKRAAPKLREAAPLLATSYEHGMTLRAMLKTKSPRILLPSSSAAPSEPTSAPRVASEEA